jgi:hypothetical protein
MSYHRSLGADDPGNVPATTAPAQPSDPLTLLEERQREILRVLRESEDRRKWSLLIGVAGAIFAAFRLGIVALPEIRRRREMGRLPPPAA